MTTSTICAEIGSRVRVLYEGAQDEDEFVLASDPTEAVQGRLSVDSPLGRALLGRRAGQRVRFRAPGGVMAVHIVAVA